MIRSPRAGAPAVARDGATYWKRNLAVCVFGSVTTIVAMTLLLPFLPIYVAQLGVTGRAAIVEWSGIAYGATFLTAGITAPLWGALADRFGRKLMLVRASLGMAVAMSLIGTAHDVRQLVAFRLLAGLLGGYSSGSMVLVATQTPAARTGWAVGVLSSGVMAGSLVGPLVGGILPPLVGIRTTFFAAGALIFVAFLATVFLIVEDPVAPRGATARTRGDRATISDRRPVLAMYVTGTLLMVATMSIEPIVTVYVAQFVATKDVTFVAGVVMSGAALGSVLSAARLGKLADRVGPWNVIVASLATCAVLLVPQAFVTASWELIALRFLMGVALGGLLPCVASVIRHSVPERDAGSALGYSISAQYAGQVIGPLAGGFVGGHFGMRAVFLVTAALMAIGAAFNRVAQRVVERG